jgi:hypothetical protein
LNHEGNWVSNVTLGANVFDGKVGPFPTTCVLDLGNAGATSSGNKTLSLGTIPTSAAVGLAGQTFGAPKTIIMSVKNKDGSPCTFGGTNTKWDVRLNLFTSQFVSAGGKTLLVSWPANDTTYTSNAGNVGVVLKGASGASPTAGTTELNLAGASANTYGVLLSGSTGALAAKSTDKIALTAQFAKTADAAVTPGIFTTTLTLDVFYE